jgi:predicted CXXCH cytochrome family protein
VGELESWRKTKSKRVLVMLIKTKRVAGLFFMLFAFLSATAQLSPGDLSNSHANLEGISNCTQCHILGNKASSDKCLTCHTDIQERINKKKGYHASTDVSGKQCANCHSEHNGKNFKLIKFDATQFNHRLTGFPLSTPHAKKACADCHISKYITDQKLKSKKNTYLGVGVECLNCHADYHQKTLPSNCLDCHNPESFKPASKFNHASAKFQLVGKHQTVDCQKCHKVEVVEGKKFQHFTGIQYSNCTNCHKDPHQNKFGQNCKQCHSEESFHNIKGNNFDHSKTNFPLVDKHLGVNCKSCHKTKVTDPIKHEGCTDCHKDYHNNQFAKNNISPDCSQCHTTKGFDLYLFTIEQHNTGPFPLVGGHTPVTCDKCHKKQEKWSFREIGKNCKDCHTDYHNNQFTKNGESPDCSQCHVMKGFGFVSYTLDQHNKGSFPLKGAHLATACNECHKKQEKWSFKDIGNNCKDCHTDIHQNFIPTKYYPNGNCKTCHNESQWLDVSFDHSKTKFSLTGSHTKQSCKACHFKKDANGAEQQKFTGLPANCSNCHSDNHYKQFEKNGLTDCTECHSTANWKDSKFDHNNAAFKLDGKHISVPCVKCHKPQQVGSSYYIKYKLKEFKCESCHS